MAKRWENIPRGPSEVGEIPVRLYIYQVRENRYLAHTRYVLGRFLDIVF